MSRAQESSQLIILSLPENGRCVPCIIYPKLVNWDSKTSPSPSDDDSPTKQTLDANSDSNTSDCDSLCSTDASDFEPSGLADSPFVPQNDFMNSDFTDFPQSDGGDDESDDEYDGSDDDVV